jgi:hypothetical protein
MSDHRYRIIYKVEHHPDGVPEDQIRVSGFGACDAILVGSLLYPDDGSYSSMFVSLDGRTGEELDSAEIWKAWTMLAKNLADETTLSPWKRALARNVFDVVRDVILEGRSGVPASPDRQS